MSYPVRSTLWYAVQQRCVLLRGVFLSSTLLVTLANAQGTPNTSREATRAAVMDPAPSVPFADADSIRNVPGHVTFTRYATAGQCLAAILLARREAVREPSRDTLPGAQHIADTLPASVQEAGAQCRARIAPGDVSSSALQDAFSLAVLLYDSAGSAALLERWLAAPQTLADRGETGLETQAKRMSKAIQLYMSPKETGPQWELGAARAHTLLTRLSALGPSVRNQRLAMQEYILNAEFGWQEQAGRFTNLPSSLRAFLALVAGIDSAGGISGPARYGADGNDLAIHLAKIRYFLDPNGTTAFADSLVRAAPSIGSLGQTIQMVAANLTTRANRSVSPLHADFWYNTDGAAVWPVPGRVSLLVLGGVTVEDGPMFRRLVHRYGPQGLRITLVKKTNGYWVRSGTETGPRTAAQEAAQDSAYYLDYLKLPATLAIEESPLTRDRVGHVRPSSPVQYERDWLSSAVANARFVLVDAAGHLVFHMNVSEAFLNAYLDRIFGVTR